MQSQSFESIALDLIDDNPELAREIDSERYAELKQSIAELGLLHPIGVSEDGDGRYTLRWGRTRLLAHQELGLKEIKVHVVETEDEDEAELARIAENLHRSEVGLDRIIQLKRYNELREKRFGPEVKNKGGRPPKTVAPRATVSDKTPEAQRPGWYRLEERVAKNFTEPQLMCLKANNVSVKDCDTIVSAAKKDPQTISNIIRQLDMGMSVPQAIEHVQSPEFGVVDEKAVKAVISQYSPEKTASSVDTEMDNDEWLRVYCGKIRPMLVQANNHHVFDWNALLYRKVHVALQEFRGAIKKAVVQEKEKGHPGPFIGMLNDLLKVEHPGNWIVCHTCTGTGKTPSGHYCSNCLGDGFKKTETRL